MLTAIDHAQITIPKGAEDAAKAFYCEFLGLKEIEKPENRKNNGGFWLELLNLEIHLGIERNSSKFSEWITSNEMTT